MKMNIIKIVKLARKNFPEIYEIAHYKFQIGDQLAVADYSLNYQILKINRKK